MLTTDIFPRTNDDWEDRSESDKTWDDWKAASKKAHAKARIKAQANKCSIKFGVENSAARLETTQCVETNKDVYEGGIKALEG